MDKVIELAKELRVEIDNLPEVIEYNKLKKLLENDEELKAMRKEIARLKVEGKEEERNNLLKVYNSHPLVNNFYLAEQEVQSILLTIKNIIQ